MASNTDHCTGDINESVCPPPTTTTTTTNNATTTTTTTTQGSVDGECGSGGNWCNEGSVANMRWSDGDGNDHGGRANNNGVREWDCKGINGGADANCNRCYQVDCGSSNAPTGPTDNSCGHGTLASDHGDQAGHGCGSAKVNATVLAVDACQDHLVVNPQ